MEILIKAAQLIVCLSLLVIVHEFGHFIFAKLFKCRVEKFYLFFNPWFSLVKFKIGETEYGLGWIPFGGYVKIAGMIDESMDKEAMKQPAQPWEFRSKPAWQRLLIMIGGVLMNLLTALVIYIGISYSYGTSYIKAEDAKYGYVFSDLAKEMGFKNGDKILSVDGEAFENCDEIPMAFILNDVKYVVVERDGKKQDISIDFDYKAQLLESKKPILALRMPMVIDSVKTESPAMKAGIMVGDSIIAVDSTSVQFRDEIMNFTTNRPLQTITLDVVRDSMGNQIVKSIPLTLDEESTMGVYFNPFIDKFYRVTQKEYTFAEAIPAGFVRAKNMLTDYIKQLKMIFTPDTGAYKQVGSVVAMGNFFPSVWDWFRFWNITALFSVMLAVMNILPIPALDGGHVMFLLYEVITRRTPSDKFMEVMQTIGMFLLLGLMVLALGNDIWRLFN